MKELNLKNITLLALVVSCHLQVGAQLFAIAVVVNTLAAAPPRSFAMLQGEYGYNSGAFWDTVPMITFLLFIVAMVTNWKTKRRKLILLALSLFIIAGVVAGFFVEPIFADMIKSGYRDHVDPVLQTQAKSWYMFDWMVWVLGLLAGLILLVALLRPISNAGESSS